MLSLSLSRIFFDVVVGVVTLFGFLFCLVLVWYKVRGLACVAWRSRLWGVKVMMVEYHEVFKTVENKLFCITRVWWLLLMNKIQDDAIWFLFLYIEKVNVEHKPVPPSSENEILFCLFRYRI